MPVHPRPLPSLRVLIRVVVLMTCAVATAAPEGEDPARVGVEAGAAAYVRFQEISAALPSADAARAFVFRGRVLRAGEHAGTWSLQARPEGTSGDWWIEEIVRLDGQFEVRREGVHAPSLYPLRGTSRLRRDGTVSSLRWHGEGSELVVTREEGGAVLTPTRHPFGGVALVGLAPYVVLAPSLREAAEGLALRATHVYDGVEAPVQVAARDLRVVTVAPWGDVEATLLVFDGPWASTVACDAASGALLGFRVESDQGPLDVVPWEASDEAASAWDLLTASDNTPAVATLRFLYALERGYLPLATSLVLWPEAGPPSTARLRVRRAWIEARRIELLAGLPAGQAAARLQALLPNLVVNEQGEEARVRLPAPYAGWTAVCARRADGAWAVRAFVE